MRCLAAALALLLAAQIVQAGNAATPQALDRIAQAAMTRHRLPGLAIVAVEDGRIVYAKGFGHRALGEAGRVDADTLFKLGSISKTITALAVTLLVEDGSVGWDDRLGRWMPELAAAHPQLVKVTVKQLLSHQSGQNLDPLEPLLWPQPNDFNFTHLLAGLAAIRSDSAAPGTGFRYSNVGYALAGELVHRASGRSYGEFVRQRIFEPLGMDCVAGQFTRAAHPNLAQPHRRSAKANHSDSLVRRDADTVPEGLDAAAGGIRCSAHALGRWLQFQLDPPSSPLRLSLPTLRALHGAQIVTATRFDAQGRPSAIETYGLGLQLTAQDGGELKLDHYGGVTGMLSYFAVSPSRRSGFALAMNVDAAAARAELIDQLTAALAGRPPPAVMARAPLPVAPPSNAFIELPLADWQRLVGRYADPWFGEVLLCNSEVGRFEWHSLRSPRLTGQLAKLADGRIALRWDDPAVQSDSVLVMGEAVAAMPQQLTLVPLGRSDFDFSALRLSRVGDCARPL